MPDSLEQTHPNPLFSPVSPDSIRFYLENNTCTLHWTEEGVKMKNQMKPLLIRPSRTLKTTSIKNFCVKSLSTIGASTWFLCVTLYVYVFAKFVQKLSTCVKSNKPRQGMKKGSSWRFHVPLIPIWVLRGLCKTFEMSHKKAQEHNHVLAPLVKNDLRQKFILEILLGVPGFSFDFLFSPPPWFSVMTNAHTG